MLSITNATSPLTAGAAGSPKRQPFGGSPEVDRKKKKLDSYKSLHPGKENIPPELQKLLHRKGRRGSPVKAGQRKVGKTFAKVPDSGVSNTHASTSEGAILV
ncbi:hypothetical protein FRC04_005039 [Tulasnella sp. 424]|nr:hypothetical protein FRC04_005039 [Tulasnella sp. 424]KAG8963282.1 hypothetical protein FRC05_004798 [Tulasnella sp. 425]